MSPFIYIFFNSTEIFRDFDIDISIHFNHWIYNQLIE